MVSESGDIFEAVLVQNVAEEKPRPKVVESPERKVSPAAKTAPPTVDEWQDFIGRFVIRGITEAYLSLALSDFYDDLSPREIESIRLTQQDLKDMSAPIATLAAKNKFLKSRGRSIIGFADSGEAVIALVIWMRRVNRLAKKYRKPPVIKTQATRSGGNVNGSDGSNVGQGPEFGTPGFGVWNPGTG